MHSVKILCISSILFAATNALALGWFGTDLKGRACDGLEQHYGPFDYRRLENRGSRLNIVESYHFNKKVEQLIAGMTAPLPADIDYTLRAFPNHHRALRSIAKFWLEQKNPSTKLPPAECYFQRAEVFVPDDYKVHLLFAIYLHKKNHLQRARKEYKLAVQYRPKSALAHYSYGLLLLDLGDLENARKQARIAAKLGYPLKGLQHRIQRAEAKLKKGKGNQSGKTADSHDGNLSPAADVKRPRMDKTSNQESVPLNPENS